MINTQEASEKKMSSFSKTEMWCSLPILTGSVSRQVTHLERGNSHLGSDGSSSSETLGSIGPSLDDRRAILTRGVFEFMEELESKDTCLSEEAEQNVIVSVGVGD